MKLVIISHTEHYLKDGKPAGWGATVREIDQLAALFSEIIHIAPLYKEAAPASVLCYEASSVKFIPVQPSGGIGFKNKLKIFSCLPQYIKTILAAVKNADVVHVRCPANISLLAIILLTFINKPKKRWIKYAGNWQSYEGEALSYKFQKWWLKKNFARAQVTVNGEWSNQPAHIHSFYNPCISEKERVEALKVTADKRLTSPSQLLFVGRLEEAKGVGRIFKIAKGLDDSNIAYALNLVGDGPKRELYESQCQALKGKILFHGWLSRSDLNHLYEKAHFILLPSKGEGWPKVLSEAMAYGGVPIASQAGSIPDYLKKIQAGRALPGDSPGLFAKEIASYMRNPDQWKEESKNAHRAGNNFTYEFYLSAFKGIIKI